MDAKTLLILWLVLINLGRSANNFMKIIGLTKTTVVKGGNATRVAGILFSTLSVVGWGIFFYTLMFHYDEFIKATEYLFGS